MKPTGRHPENALTAVKVRNLREPGRFADGNGLYLVVDPSGAKRWMLRTLVRGKRTDIGLGSVRLVPLADAREEARKLRRIARDGGDPLAEKRKAQTVPTFEEAARKVHGDRAKGWRNRKHSQQWINTLQAYAFPIMGTRRVDQIGTADLLNVLGPVWLTKPETARRVRQRIGVVLDWAATAGHRTGENPALNIGRGLPRQTDKKNPRHHAALPYVDVPGFVRSLCKSDAGEATQLALEFLILTAARTGEVLTTKPDEIDFDKATWTVPGERMKGVREHRVPLSDRCVEIVRQARELSDGAGYLFPGARIGKPLSNMAFLMYLRRADLPCTAHGFRSSFRDWAADRTTFPREVVEAALAHVVESKVEAAYLRSDLFEKRGRLMKAWSAYVASESGDVVALRRRQG